MVRLNGAGDDRINPIFSGASFTIIYHKHISTETVTKCWIEVEGVEYYDLTGSVVDSEYELTIDVTAGTELQSSTIGVLNYINFITSVGTTTVGVWITNPPTAMITLDGYSSPNELAPAVYRLETL